MVTSSEKEKSILLLWLNLLGWQVHVEHTGSNLVGIARHCSAEGSSFRVDAFGWEWWRRRRPRRATQRLVLLRCVRERRPLSAPAPWSSSFGTISRASENSFRARASGVPSWNAGRALPLSSQFIGMSKSSVPGVPGVASHAAAGRSRSLAGYEHRVG